MKDTQSKGLLWVVAAGLFMQSLDTTIVNTALPAIAASLRCEPIALHPIIIAYSLTLAVLTPLSGWLADKIGTRRVFFCAVILFVLGSMCCAMAHTLHQLVGARILQGTGGAMLMPVGRLALLRAFSRERYLSALAFVSIAAQIAPLVGPVLGGWIVQVASWPWIFMINLPIGVVGCIAVMGIMPKGKAPQPPGRFDVWGFTLLAGGMASFFLGLEPPQLAVGRVWWTAGLLSAAVIAAVAYLIHASRTPRVLFPLTLFDDRGFRIGLLGNLISRVGSSAVPFLLPLLFQLHLGYSPFHAGLLLIPMAVCGIFCKPLVAPLVQRMGYVRFLSINTIVLGASILGFAAIVPTWPLAVVLAQLAVFGAANSMQFAAMNSVTLKDLDSHYISSGNSLFSMVQMLSMALGVAVAGGLVPLFSFFAGERPESLHGFQWAFLGVGAVTLLAAKVFSWLDEVPEPVQAQP